MSRKSVMSMKRWAYSKYFIYLANMEKKEESSHATT